MVNSRRRQGINRRKVAERFKECCMLNAKRVGFFLGLAATLTLGTVLAADESATAIAEKAQNTAKHAEEKAEEAVEKMKALEKSLSTPPNRASRRIGAQVSLWGDPFPTTYGISIAYNVYDFLRVNASIGSDDENQLFKANTLGIGAKLMVPGWELTPVVGANLTLLKSDNSDNRAVKGYNPRDAVPYANLGIDWQTYVGLNFGVGYILPVAASLAGSYYLNAGLFF
jgi:hypothetical protein